MAYTRPSADETNRVSDRLLYEVEMMAGLADRIARTRTLLEVRWPNDDLSRQLHDLAGRNADIESFGIHARVLWCFLFADRRLPTDVVARDFFDSDPLWRDVDLASPPALDGIRLRVGQGVAHLTYVGAQQLDEQWAVGSMWTAFTPVLNAFFDQASEGRLDAKVRAEAKRILGARSDELDRERLWQAQSATADSPARGLTPPVIQAGTVLMQLPWHDPLGE